MKPFNLGKALSGEKVVTRDGKTVEILKRIHAKSYPIVGIITKEDGIQTAQLWTEEGRFWLNREHSDDLFMAPKRRKVTDITGTLDHKCHLCSNIHYVKTFRDVNKEDVSTVISHLESKGYTVKISEYEVEE